MKKINIWLSIVISVIFLGVVVYKVDIATAVNTLKSVNLIYLFLGLATGYLSIYLKSIRWGYLLQDKHGENNLFPIYIIGLLFANIIPGTGELSRSYVLRKKENISIGYSMGINVFEKFIDTSFFLVCLLFLTAKLSGYDWTRKILLFISLGFIMFAVLIYVFTFFKKYAPVKLFMDGLNSIRKINALNFTIVYIISFLVWLLTYMSAYFGLLAFNFSFPIYFPLLLLVVLNLGLAIPSALGGIGTYEFICIAVLSYISVNKSVALSYAVVMHAISILTLVIIGLACLWHEKIKWIEVEKETGV